MSLPKLKGKTKSDLIEIAHLTGLLTSKETNRMTKAQILEVLENADEEHQKQKAFSEEIESILSPETKKTDTETTKKKTTRKTRTAKKPKEDTKISDPITISEDSKQIEFSEIEEESVESLEIKNTDKIIKEEEKKPETKSEEVDEADEKKIVSKEKKEPAKKRNVKSKKEISEAEPDSMKEVDETQSETKSKSTEKSKVTEETQTTDETKSEEKTEVTEKSEPSEKKSAISTKDNSSKKTEKPNTKARRGKAKATEKKIIDLPGTESSSKDKNENDQSVKDNSKNKKQEKIEEQEIICGILEIMPDNYGFLRVENYLQSNRDFYVPPQFIRRFNLRNGDKIEGPAKIQKDSEKYRAISYINLVNDLPPEQMIHRPHFDRLTPIYPNEKYKLETHSKELATRMIDLISPIGKGQRGMIVSPPKAGKTILLQKIANSISINNPDTKLFVLLIDERPEEVTDMQRSINGEVIYSTFDKTPENHVKITELVLERAMRLVELGQDVVILLDSITRMSRAYNLTINPTGRTLSGGLDPGALHGPKRFFGAARNIENGGSLTIIATALIETGSRMDEVIFEEFKGTGNMEVVLDRKLAEKRVFPAIDLNKSSTRREDLLMTKEELNTVWAMRKAFTGSETLSVTETVINLLLKTKSNEQFANSISVSLKDKDLFEAMRGNPVITPNTNGNTAGNNNNNNNNRVNTNGIR